MEMLHFHSQYSELSLSFPENFFQSKGIENVENLQWLLHKNLSIP